MQIARAALYPDAMTADVSEERLRRFFIKEHRGYRVRRELRELVLFASHDLLKDAPFSRLDLISCRNLLIYLNRDAQTRAFQIFHFSLNLEGLLFLGASESVEEVSTLFEVLDKKHRLYVRKPTPRTIPVPSGPSTLLIHHIGAQVAAERAEAANPPVVVPGARFLTTPRSSESPLGSESGPVQQRGSLSELHFRLIERLGPPSLLVNAEHEIQHLSENAGRFFQVMGGEPTTQLLRLIHPALRPELRAALFRAAQNNQPAESFAVPMELEGQPRAVDIRVAPASELAPGYLLITLDARFVSERSAESSRVASPAGQPDPIIQHLERELDQTKGRLRETVEQYEAGTEELKASNEELQAMNEELRSATEELETSREELQSINEELTTVNQELKENVDQLAHANSDLRNLMGATAIATIFLDRELRILRYTDSAISLFNLIPGDIGRPLNDLQRRIDYPELAADGARVLETLVPIERQVTGDDNKHFLARVLPYRTTDDHIGGVVMTFVDITERNQAQEVLRQSVEELSRFNKVAVGRESRMIELKKEINALCVKLGEPSRYPLEFDRDKPSE